MNYSIFTENMKKDYTILVPTMLPLHFSMIIGVMRSYGYKAELLKNSGSQVKTAGLKYVHNDTCYPAQVVIGQLMDAINSGKYDKHKIALMISQTGGGCRASNYISLLRKALFNAGYDYIPVVSINVSGLDKSGFKLTIPMIYKMFYAIMLGDLLMNLKNQCEPYEVTKGLSANLAEKWTKSITEYLTTHKVIRYSSIKQIYRNIINEYGDIPLTDTEKTKVGIVGEIFVKFSPLGNNELEKFLLEQNAEVKMAGLLDFCLYCIYDSIMDTKLYGIRKCKCMGASLLYNYILKKQRDMIKIINKDGRFQAPTEFDHIHTLTEGVIGLGVKMGEGWLLTAEMIELIENGVENIICTQPFGCLPNHIAGKGMMKLIKEKYPSANIVAIDYDASASKVNQENRIKLMLSATQKEKV